MKWFFSSIGVAMIPAGFAQNPMMIPTAIQAGEPTVLNLAPGLHNFGSGIEAASLGANGSILGPTLIVHQGETADWSVINGLEESTTMHWHGMHVSPENDGGPHSIIAPGATWNPMFEVLDEAGTYWYHPHLHMMTDMHVSKGIAGMIWVRDAEEQALDLPRTYAEDEFPIILQTKAFNADGEIIAHSNSDTLLCVNATVDATLNVPPAVVRFHLLNGSSQRVFYIGLSNDVAFHLMATDGGLLPEAVALTRLRLSPGERAEILVDCAPFADGSFSVMSYASEFGNGVYGGTYPGMMSGQQLTGYDPNPMNGDDFELFTVQVNAPLPLNAVFDIPSTLDPSNANPYFNPVVNRNLTMSPVSMGMNALNGDFVINGAPYNMDVINYTIPLGSQETWTISNNSPTGHPFHIHDVQFYLIERNGVTPPAEERGRKDVVFIPAMQSAKFICQFDDFADSEIPYMYHCHMLVHEDGGMMGQFLVVEPNEVDEAVEASEGLIYPNPALQQATCVHPEGALQFEVFTSSGKRVMNRQILLREEQIELEDWPTGIYLVRWSNETGKPIQSQRLLIAR